MPKTPSAASAEPRPVYRQVNVRLPADLFDALAEAARLDHRKLSSAVSVAAQRYIEEVRDDLAAREAQRVR